MKKNDPAAVCLISGGMDSAVAAGLAREAGFTLHALSFNYGQRHRLELRSAKRVALWLGALDHKIIRLELDKIGGSALTADLPVPKNALGPGIPVTYVPARNLIFLAIAAALAETVGAQRIVIGANAIDFSGYPDCRPEFMAAFEAAARLGTRAGTEGRAPTVWAPLIALSKAEIVRAGQRLGLDFGITCSCYDPAPDGRPCGRCDSCLLRAKGFAEAGGADPLRR
jgi:7-cyano-7-deazaguanine synthase